MKRIFNHFSVKTLITVITVVILLNACKRKDPYEFEEGEAKIKIVNALRGSAPQDFYQNNQLISDQAISYGQASPYFTIKSGLSQLIMRNGGTSTITIASDAALQNDLSYLAFYYSDHNGETRLTGFSGQSTAPDSDKAKVRFIHLGVQLGGGINVQQGSNNVTPSLSFGAVTDFLTIQANTDLQLSLAGVPFSTISGSSFQGGKVYTVWFDATSTTSFDYHIVNPE